MKPLLSILLLLFLATPSYADQALVLTEIEQIQEKLWYLQRDLAAQKTTLENVQKKVSSQHTMDAGRQDALEKQLAGLLQSITAQQENTQQFENELQTVKESITALVNEFNQQNTAQLQQAEKSGTQEGLLHALRTEVAANQTSVEAALNKTREDVAELKTQLKSLQEKKPNSFDRLGLYLGGAALAMALLLTIAFAVLNNKSKRNLESKTNRTRHEL